MRTTLTIDDDLIRELHRISRTSERPFKEVVNETLRQGLSAGKAPSRRAPRFQVKPKACGFRAGFDLTRLNQLVDELEIERASLLVVRDR